MKNKLKFLTLLLMFCSGLSIAQTPILGEIKMFAGTFTPSGYASCDGQLLPISQYTALFSLLGTTYGGDGQTTFGLPDLRGRSPIHVGYGPGLTPRQLGEKGGSESNILTTLELPSHSHSVLAVADDGNQSVPSGNLPAGTKILDKEYSNATANTSMNSAMIANTGHNIPVNNVQPYVVINYIIALEGIYPSQN